MTSDSTNIIEEFNREYMLTPINPRVRELKERIRNIDSMLSPKDIRDRYSKSGQNALVRMRSTAVSMLKEMGETE